MPRGIPKAKNPELYGGSPAVPGTGTTDAVKPVVEVRPAIVQMSGVSSSEELASQLPDSTINGNPERKKYQRKPKEETQKDPLLSDPVYVDSLKRMSGFGGPQAIKSTFSITGKPLNDDERKDVDAYFYLLTARYPEAMDPMKNVFFTILTGIALVLRLCFVRFKVAENLFEQLQALFEGKKEEDEEQEGEVNKK